MRFLTPFLLSICVVAVAHGQVRQRRPYRQINLKTNVKVESSREKESTVRYSPWGNLSSSDRRYTQRVRLRIAVKNVSGRSLTGLRLLYRIYRQSLDQKTDSVAIEGEKSIREIDQGKTITLFTEEIVCRYRLRWSSLVRGNRLARSGEKYAGYVVLYCDEEGPICWDASSQTMFTDHAKELQQSQDVREDLRSSVSSPSSPEGIAADGQVYLTRTGEKFHRENCRYVKDSSIVMSRQEAINSGHTPCSVCKP
jgi:hypothetical protein